MRHTKYIFLIVTFAYSYSAVQADPGTNQNLEHSTKYMNEFLKSAFESNLKLKSLENMHNSVLSKAESQGYLPDPVLQSNVFIKPIETRVGAQKANIMLMQQLPWPGKLDAKEQEVIAKAEGLRFQIIDAKLALKAELYKMFYDGYFLKKRLELNHTQKPLLENLAQIALAQVRVGSGTGQDATQATLELARLEQDTAEILRDLGTLTTKINTLANRNPDNPVEFPQSLSTSVIPSLKSPEAKNELKSQMMNHPRLQLAKAEISSSESGRRLAELEGIPDIKLSVSWFAIDEGSAMNPSKKNEDAWAVGAGISIPVWWHKYSNIEQSAVSESLAKRSMYENEKRLLENSLADLMGQYNTSLDLIDLYKQKIIPGSEQIFLSNQSAYQQGTVTFDRVISDLRSLLKARIGFYKQIAEYNTTVTRLEQILGQPLDQTLEQTMDSNAKKGS